MDDSFQGHTAPRLFLDKTFYKAFIRLQADKSLGQSFAGLLIYTEGLHSLGYITDAEYEEHVKRYSQPLCDAPRTPTMEGLRQQEELVSWEKRFSLAIEQWPSMNGKSRQYHLQKARELVGRVSNAKLVLSLANGEQRNDENLEGSR